MFNIKKRFFSVLMLLTFVFNFTIQAFAMGDSELNNNNDMIIENIIAESKDLGEQYPELKEINQNIISLLEEGYTEDEVHNMLPDDDIKTLLKIRKETNLETMDSGNYLKQGMVQHFSSDYEMNEYIREVEELAAYYQEYFEKNGEFPQASASYQV